MNPLSPLHMTPAERRAELCRLMALGLVRVLQRQSTDLSEKTGESSLDFPAEQMGHATSQSRSVA
ncbi:MAG: hypothetical protein EON56_01415 [Alphaproteobacteria bacterium]|nr:MAG: hypothetical protein EON56_01415 [Alphaproteobacteria bacterium]